MLTNALPTSTMHARRDHGVTRYLAAVAILHLVLQKVWLVTCSAPKHSLKQLSCKVGCPLQVGNHTGTISSWYLQHHLLPQEPTANEGIRVVCPYGSVLSRFSGAWNVAALSCHFTMLVSVWVFMRLLCVPSAYVRKGFRRFSCW